MISNRRSAAGVVGNGRSSLLPLAAAAALLLGGAPLCSHAQNAAQRAALARLALSRGAHPQDAQPGGVEATTVPLLAPHQLAFDSAGNLYIADTGDNLIREINLTGVINTVAGSGQQGFSGDGGQATAAELDSPTGIAVDANGNLYIADTHNQRIREVSGGVIGTLAGTGVAGFSGDGGAPASAQLDNPTALAFDQHGNLYIADSDNQRIREISGTTISTAAGNGVEGFAGDGGAATAASLDEPTGLAFDASGNLYIADVNNQRVRMVAASTGVIATVAGSGVKGFTGDGPALTTELASPSGVAVDAGGNIYVADADNDRIREISGGNLTTIAGNGVQGLGGDTGSAASAILNTPRTVLAGSSSILFSDTGNNLVRVISAGNVSSTGGVPTAGAESLIIGSALTSVYGAGTLTASFSNNGAVATGQVSFYDQQPGGSVLIGQANLSGNAASIGTGLLSAGTHSILASYAGDVHNNAIVSGVYLYVVTPAPLTAVANAVNLLYGQAIPALTGTLTGVLSQDAGKVTAVFATAATSTSAPGSYPITVTITGSAAANYTVSLGAGSGAVIIGQAPTTTALTAGSATPILGANLTLTATVASTTGATPAGTVNFYSGATLLNATPVAVNAGVAAYTTSSLAVGAQSLTAVYSGNVDFLGSTSSTLAITELSPDFGITSSPASQTVLPSQSVNYTLTLTPVNGTFVYPVSLSASGLPSGVTATFSPASLPTGSAATTVTLTLSASAVARMEKQFAPFQRWGAGSALALLLPLFFRRRMRKTASRLSHAGGLLLAMLALGLLGVMSGCGGGGFFAHTTQASTVTITAVCGPDTHATSVNLTVQ
jgi:sugar lactone lactonase YvrE